MLTIPSTHLVIFTYSGDERLTRFLERCGRQARISLLVGARFADIKSLVEHYLPKPALDRSTSRMMNSSGTAPKCSERRMRK